MQVRVLGCSGGIGGARRTTALLVDDDILIDAGTGVGNLTLAEMTQVRHVFLTHSHLDHIACLPLLIDSIFDTLREPLTVHGSRETLDALRTHIFNWVVWPDFSQIPSLGKGVLAYREMAHGERRALGDRTFEMIPVDHAVPGVAYRVESRGRSLAFSGDTATNDTLWDALNAHPTLDALIVEAAFRNRDQQIADLAKHYTAHTLAADLAKLRHKPRVYITHLKPGSEDDIDAECDAALGFDAVRLVGGEIIEL